MHKRFVPVALSAGTPRTAMGGSIPHVPDPVVICAPIASLSRGREEIKKIQDMNKIK
jgi:hypothetical protein